ncbi:hypothetical protein [Pectinatus cerevisiiphilus]|uniref:Uncharacterized protein n=1 Tax=Pectinatus cerevisiiphilus TaxID=86956 RepID=A0A4R3K4Q5_9FIRM|nr:hypothetical protein [Pectinatus cerevisiiphilus]TCS77675.1 hypothetical protein EDC37_11476 [Pectinatus cerevisiiphilus]
MKGEKSYGKSVQVTIIDKSPESMCCDIDKAAEDLYEKMDQFLKVEQEYILSPETWLEYEPKHEAIKESLQNLQAVQANDNICCLNSLVYSRLVRFFSWPLLLFSYYFRAAHQENCLFYIVAYPGALGELT